MVCDSRRKRGSATRGTRMIGRTTYTPACCSKGTAARSVHFFACTFGFLYVCVSQSRCAGFSVCLLYIGTVTPRVIVSEIFNFSKIQHPPTSIGAKPPPPRHLHSSRNIGLDVLQCCDMHDAHLQNLPTVQEPRRVSLPEDS